SVEVGGAWRPARHAAVLRTCRVVTHAQVGGPQCRVTSVGAAVAVFDGPHGAELLDEHGRAGVACSSPEVTDPAELHWSRVRAGFAADDQPVDAVEVERGEWPEERLRGDEPQCGWGGPQ